MDINLVNKVDYWLVTHVVGNEQVNKRFDTIEKAADFMVDELKVHDDDIDDALCEMVGFGHTRAIFTDGCYARSEPT